MLAVLLWLVVIAQEPNKTYTITGVSVSYDYNSALYTGASLDIVKSDDIKVSVVVSGDSSAIGGVDNLTSSCIPIIPRFPVRACPANTRCGCRRAARIRL